MATGGSSRNRAGVLIPQGTIVSGGVTFTGKMSDGSTFSGIMKNRIGTGYSVLDGFGFINAESAVNESLPPGRRDKR